MERTSILACALVVAMLGACGGANPAGDDADAVLADLGLDVSIPTKDVVFGDDGVGDPGGDPGPGPDDGDAAGDPGTTPDAAADAGPDTGWPYECVPMTLEDCTTVCGTAGRRKCLKEWGPCFPWEETCGNCQDDDCDGAVDEDCPPDPDCQPPVGQCPVAVIDVAIENGGAFTGEAWTGDVLVLSGKASYAQEPGATVAAWAWSVQPPAGTQGTFLPGPTAMEPRFQVDAAGQYLFLLEVRDDRGTDGCAPAVATVTVRTFPPLEPEVGCADGSREGFLVQETWPQIAACSGAWERPGITPDAVVPTCNRQGGNTGANPAGTGCSSADLCAVGWHVCKAWQEVAQKSATGCAGATPPDAKPKSLFFAIRQPSKTHSQCGVEGDGNNDVFGCGNLGHALSPDKGCGPLDRVLASMQPNVCGYNEAEPPLGPWECRGGAGSDLAEGANVTKKACGGGSCQYDGQPVLPSDKGGVLCCRDPG